ncbi:unnamed protein product [Paramecium sonneborni]|uniref:MORN repeat protein n=1 Tax=Paramecium sonneborni TaxID=65129 RepID=A0A8S1P4S5_9CILI|nr:unnamed protein product [Paramecium sonneborni]
MNYQTDQFTNTKAQFSKITVTQVLEHLHNCRFPTTEPETNQFIQNYKPLIIEDYEDLINSPNFTIIFEKQNLFYGIVINGKKNGLGVQFKNQKSIFEGVWIDNQKNGRGIELFFNGSYYFGQYQDGKPEGFGKFQWQNDETYEGQWFQGKKHGSGIWKGSKGDSYIGEWKMGVPDGYGVHQWINGDRYEGEFKNYLKDGYGTEKFINGDTYIGQYEKGKPNGIGEYFWNNGAVYKGEFKDGLRHGKGIWKRGNGLSDSYKGDYQNDLKQGYGIYSWADGNRYEGSFSNDLRDGQGNMYWNDGSFYQGQWKQGIQDGQGILSLNQELIKGIFYGTKVIEIIENTQLHTNLIKNKIPQLETNSRQTSYSTDDYRQNQNYSLMDKRKNSTEYSTKVNSFTQTYRDSNSIESRLQNIQATKKTGVINSKLLNQINLRFPKMQQEQSNKQKVQKKLWKPTGVPQNVKF